MSVFNLHQSVVAGAVGATGGITAFDTTLIGNSVFLNGSDEDINRTGFTLSADGQKELIVSVWVQRLEFGRAQEIWILGNSSGITSYNDLIHANFNADDTLNFSIGHGGSSGGQIKPNRLFRDISWYHLLFSFNSNTSVTDDKNRLQLYVNGERQSDLATDTAVPDNQDVRGSLTGTADFRFGRNTHGSLGYFHNCYYAQACYLEGKSIQAGDFAVSDFLDTFTMGTNGSQFTPKANADIAALATSAGGNSFCLDFADPSDLGNDISNNNKDFTATNMAAVNQSENTPSKLYPIINIIDHSETTLPTISEGNLRSAGPGASRACLRTTIPIPTTGKWYWEAKWNSVASARIGFAESNSQLLANCGQSALSWGIQNDGKLINNNVQGTTFFSWSTNDIIAMAYDADNSKFWFGRIASGDTSVTWASSGNPETGANATVTSVPTQITPALDTNTGDVSLIFPEEDWTLSSKLSGFNEINSKRLTAPTHQGIDYFDTTIYEGNGKSQRVGDFVPFTDLYTVDNSIIFDLGTKNHLQRTMSAASANSNSQFIISAWVKRVSLDTTWAHAILESTNANGQDATGFRVYSSGTQLPSGAYESYSLYFYAQGSGVTGSNVDIRTRASVGLTSAWQHVMCKVDTNQAVATDRIKLYIDGVLQTNLYVPSGTPSYPDKDAVFYLGDNDYVTQIGKIPYNASAYNDIYVAEHAFITGTNAVSKTISDFGAVDTATNKWVPKDISGFTFGHNGHYLEFKTTPGSGNGSGTDTSGNGNHFAEAINNSASAWSSYTFYKTVDTPSKNWPTLSQITGLTPTGTASGVADMSDGNLRMNVTGGNNSNSPSHTPSEAFAIQEGKWYFEVEAITIANGWNLIGLTDVDDYQQQTLSGSGFIDDAEPGQWGYAINTASTSPDGIIKDGNFLYDTSGAQESPFNGISNHKVDTGDVLGVYVERIGNLYKMWFSRNGTHYLRNTTQPPIIEFGTLNRVIPFARTTNGTGNRELHFNFGQQLVFDGSTTTFNAASGGYWKYAPVAGFKAINQDNLDATQDKLTAFAWIKNRDVANSHVLATAIEGADKPYATDPDTPAAAVTTVSDKTQRFLKRGVQIGIDPGVNSDRKSYVLWQWMADSITPTDHAIGSIDGTHPQLSSKTIVPEHGAFSIMTYEGNEDGGGAKTVAHGMGGTPEAFWTRNVDTAGQNTPVYHKALTATHYILLNQGDISYDNINYWNDTEPTPDRFTVGTGATPDTNDAGKTFQAVAFRSVPGVCKVGSYTGNLNDDGPYISLGFKPRWIMLKSTSTAREWVIFDTVRDVINVSDHRLDPSNNGVEFNAALDLDFLSDGFKIRSDDIDGNAENVTYIYIAMAEIGGNGTLPPIYGR
jgi:hypothetical protein